MLGPSGDQVTGIGWLVWLAAIPATAVPVAATYWLGRRSARYHAGRSVRVDRLGVTVFNETTRGGGWLAAAGACGAAMSVAAVVLAASPATTGGAAREEVPGERRESEPAGS